MCTYAPQLSHGLIWCHLSLLSHSERAQLSVLIHTSRPDTVDTTYPQLPSLGTVTLGSEMKEYAGGFSQIVTGYKVYGELTLRKKTASAIHLSLQESTSERL